MKVEMLQVPKNYVGHFLTRLDCEVDSIRMVSHKRPPVYYALSKKFSFKLFDIQNFVNCIHEQRIVSLKTAILYSGREEICKENRGNMTIDEEIQEASLHSPWDIDQANLSNKRPTMSANIEVSTELVGRATREIEVIWWPDLYKSSNNGKLVIRFYIKKTHL